MSTETQGRPLAKTAKPPTMGATLRYPNLRRVGRHKMMHVLAMACFRREPVDSCGTKLSDDFGKVGVEQVVGHGRDTLPAGGLVAVDAYL